MGATDIHSCRTCSKVQAEAVMLEYNDQWFCSLNCRLKQERKDDDALRNPRPRVVRYNEH